MMQALAPVTSITRVSDDIRTAFCAKLESVRASLTMQEIEFLTGMMKYGTDEEISICQKKLADPKLFPARTRSDDEKDLASTFGSSSTAAGSARRRESLHMRKSSVVHGQMWKAHQNGLAVSRKASRLSISQKERSFIHIQAAPKGGKSAFHQSINNLDWSDSDDEVQDVSTATKLPSLSTSLHSTSRNSLRSYTRSSQTSATFRRLSILSMSTSSAASSTSGLYKTVSLRRPGSDRQLGLEKPGTQVAPVNSEDEKRAALAPPRRHTSYQTRRAVPDPTAIIEGEEEDSPKTERPSPELCERLSWPGEKEEKKLNDEEIMETEKEKRSLRFAVRRASSNSYSGEGMEVDFMSRSRELEFMSGSGPIAEQDNEEEDEEEETEEDEVNKPISVPPLQSSHVMIMRRASVNTYNGEGMEIADWDLHEEMEEQRRDYLDNYRQSPHHVSGAVLPEEEPTNKIALSASFDETQSKDRLIKFPSLPRGPGKLQRSYSEDELAAVLTVHLHRARRTHEKHGSGATASTAESFSDTYDEFEYDPWDEKVSQGMGRLTFRILGTSADDVDSHPHVLSPPLMESIQAFMPQARTSDNFWMKYSMVRDAASMKTFLQRARGANYSILAIETVDGEVMGSFTSEPWRQTWSYFGGGESFLWRMRHPRKVKCHSIIDVAHLESELDVYPYTGENNCVQFCTSQKIAVGGGLPAKANGKSTMESVPGNDENETKDFQDHNWGFGIALQSDFLHGSSSPCATFGSPSLSTLHSDGSLFEIINIELWTMTPCYSEADAEKLELGRMFLEQQSLGEQSNEDLNVLYG